MEMLHQHLDLETLKTFKHKHEVKGHRNLLTHQHKPLLLSWDSLRCQKGMEPRYPDHEYED